MPGTRKERLAKVNEVEENYFSKPNIFLDRPINQFNLKINLKEFSEKKKHEVHENVTNQGRPHITSLNLHRLISCSSMTSWDYVLLQCSTPDDFWF